MPPPRAWPPPTTAHGTTTSADTFPIPSNPRLSPTPVCWHGLARPCAPAPSRMDLWLPSCDPACQQTLLVRQSRRTVARMGPPGPTLGACGEEVLLGGLGRRSLGCTGRILRSAVEHAVADDEAGDVQLETLEAHGWSRPRCIIGHHHGFASERQAVRQSRGFVGLMGRPLGPTLSAWPRRKCFSEDSVGDRWVAPAGFSGALSNTPLQMTKPARFTLEL
jgi:hypothetical protein